MFLPDTCSARLGEDSNGGKPMKLSDLVRPEGMPEPVRVAGQEHEQARGRVRNARAVIEAREREELNRLLYVAMTRARDRLYIAGFEGKNGRDKNCWYDLINDGLAGSLSKVEVAPELPRASARAAADRAARAAPRRSFRLTLSPVALPPWASAKAPARAAADRAVEPVAARALRPRQRRRASGRAPTARTSYRTRLRWRRLRSPTATASCAARSRTRCSSICLAFDPRKWRKVAKAVRGRTRQGAFRRARRRASSRKRSRCWVTPRSRPSSALRAGPRCPSSPSSRGPSGAGPALRIAGQIDRLVELPRRSRSLSTTRPTAPRREPLRRWRRSTFISWLPIAWRFAEIFPGKAGAGRPASGPTAQGSWKSCRTPRYLCKPAMAD